jgi:hypothetical protein
MGYLLLWVEGLAASILLVALITACSARLEKRWAQILWPTLAGLFVLGKAVAFSVVAFWLAAFLVAPDWRAYFLSLAVFIAAGTALVLRLGLRRSDKDAPVPQGRAWPRGRLALGLAVAAILNIMTYNNIDSAMNLKLASMRTEAGALALSASPPRVPDRDNAALIYEEAFRAMPEHDELPKRLQKVMAAGSAKRDKSFYDDPSVAQYLKLHEPALWLLRRAATMSDCYFEHNYGRPSFEMLLPEVQHLRQGARLLVLEARYRAAKGDMQGALEDAVAVGRLGDHINQQPILISHMLAVACHGMQTQCLESVLAFGSPAGEDLALWSGRPTLSNSVALTRALRMEEALGLRMMSKVLSEDSARTLSQLSGGGDDSNRWFLGLMQSPWRVFMLPGDMASYPETMRKAQRLAAQPYFKCRRQWEFLEPRMQGKRTGIMTGMLIPALGHVARSSARMEAKNRLADLAVGVTKYKLKHAKYPAKLADLVPGFLPAVPIDPLGGKPLRMVAADGGLVLYSVGPDGDDDGGAEWDSTKGYGGSDFVSGDGDYTFCLGQAYQVRRLKAK